MKQLVNAAAHAATALFVRAQSRLVQDDSERGAETVEVAIIALIIVLIVLVAAQQFFGVVSDVINRAKQGLSGLGGGA